MKHLIPLLLPASLLLAACDPITMGLVTAGGGVAVNHQMSSTITRTFSLGSAPVEAAVLSALDRMSIQVKHREQHGNVESIQAVAGTRAVSVQIEPVTRTSTLIEVAVRQDLLSMDGATGREIVAQTELALNQQAGSGGTGTLAANAPQAPANDSLPGKTTYYGYDHPKATTVAKAARAPARAPAAAAAARPSVGSDANTPNASPGSPSAGADGSSREVAQVHRVAGGPLAVASAP
ncbi:MAG: hypothetical protein KGI67_15475 [Pseudomonadota bacterium]|nr:hypothetical protein [Pseudomonadota bacterium]